MEGMRFYPPEALDGKDRKPPAFSIPEDPRPQNDVPKSEAPDTQRIKYRGDEFPYDKEKKHEQERGLNMHTYERIRAMHDKYGDMMSALKTREGLERLLQDDFDTAVDALTEMADFFTGEDFRGAYADLVKDPVLGPVADHDVGAYINAFVPALDLLKPFGKFKRLHPEGTTKEYFRYSLDQNEKKRDRFLDGISGFAKIGYPMATASIGDVLLRKVEDKDLSEFRESVDGQYVVDGIDNVIGMKTIKKVRAGDLPDYAERLERGQVAQEDDTLEIDMFDSGERDVVFSVASKNVIVGAAKSGEYELNNVFLINKVGNTIRNAAKAEVGAKRVEVQASIENETGDLLVAVLDSGIGLPPQMLDESDKENFMFLHGVSGTGSTGIGTGGLPGRMEALGGEVAVLSKQKSSGEESSFGAGGSVDNFSFTDSDEPVSTAFVFRIKKKQNVDTNQSPQLVLAA